MAFSEELLKEALAKLDAGEQVDMCYANGLVYSGKEITAHGDGTFSIYHGIDGSWTNFSREGIEQVLRDQRSAWDGDLPDDESEPPEECPECGASFTINDGDITFSVVVHDEYEGLWRATCQSCKRSWEWNEDNDPWEVEA